MWRNGISCSLYDVINTNEGPNRNQLTQGRKCTRDRKVAPANQTKAAKAKVYRNRLYVGRRLADALYGKTWSGFEEYKRGSNAPFSLGIVQPVVTAYKPKTSWHKAYKRLRGIYRVRHVGSSCSRIHLAWQDRLVV